MGHYTGKVVWITGASSGIGEALAYELARRGAKLILSARRTEQLEAVRARCERPGDHLVLPLDLADAAKLPEAAKQVLDRFGAIDILVNNSGISQRSMANETSLDVDRRVMEVNYMGTVALTKAVLPSMLERGRGHIVVVSSLAGKVGTPLRSAYCASKHALQGFFDCLRAEVHDRGLRVTIVCPGFVKTDITVNALKGDGSSFAQMGDAQAKAMTADEFARKCASELEREGAEIMIGGGFEVTAVKLSRFLPGLYRYLVRRVKST